MTASRSKQQKNWSFPLFPYWSAAIEDVNIFTERSILDPENPIYSIYNASSTIHEIRTSGVLVQQLDAQQPTTSSAIRSYLPAQAMAMPHIRTCHQPYPTVYQKRPQRQGCLNPLQPLFACVHIDDKKATTTSRTPGRI